MTPEQIELVRSSYASLRARAPARAAEFYRRLFATEPSAEPLFTSGPDVMPEKFANELDAIVQAIVSFDAFTARVSDLASRHATYSTGTTTVTVP